MRVKLEITYLYLSIIITIYLSSIIHLSNLSVIVNFIYQFDWTKGCLGNSKNTSECVCEGVSRRDYHLSHRLSRWPSPMKAGMIHTFEVSIEQADRNMCILSLFELDIVFFLFSDINVLVFRPSVSDNIYLNIFLRFTFILEYFCVIPLSPSL